MGAYYELHSIDMAVPTRKIKDLSLAVINALGIAQTKPPVEALLDAGWKIGGTDGSLAIISRIDMDISRKESGMAFLAAAEFITDGSYVKYISDEYNGDYGACFFSKKSAIGFGFLESLIPSEDLLDIQSFRNSGEQKIYNEEYSKEKVKDPEYWMAFSVFLSSVSASIMWKQLGKAKNDYSLTNKIVSDSDKAIRFISGKHSLSKEDVDVTSSEILESKKKFEIIKNDAISNWIKSSRKILSRFNFEIDDMLISEIVSAAKVLPFKVVPEIDMSVDKLMTVILSNMTGEPTLDERKNEVVLQMAVSDYLARSAGIKALAMAIASLNEDAELRGAISGSGNWLLRQEKMARENEIILVIADKTRQLLLQEEIINKGDVNAVPRHIAYNIAINAGHIRYASQILEKRIIKRKKG